MAKVLVACDKFKGSLSAQEVASNIATGLRASGPLDVETVLVADGGDGTIAALTAAGFSTVTTVVAGPTGAPGKVQFAKREGCAVIELAECCGILLLPAGQLDPLGAHTVGLGQAIAAALDEGAREIVISVGGSASTDGGTGMLVGLGARLLDASGCELTPGARNLGKIVALDLTRLHPGLRTARIELASDVLNPLLGGQGAVAVFGPQKGVSNEMADQVEAGMANWAQVVASLVGCDYAKDPGTGSAGGVGFAARAVLGAQIRSGIDLVLDLIGIDEAIARVDLIITGEGRLDGQTLLGKTVVGVARRAQRLGVPVVAMCGRLELDEAQLAGVGVARAYSLSQLEPDAATSMSQAAPLLRQLAAQLRSEFIDKLGDRP